MQENLEDENRRLKEEIALLKKELNQNPYKVLFDATPDIIIQLDRQHKIIVCHIPGHPKEILNALKGMDIFQVTPEELRSNMLIALEKVFTSGETVNYESQGHVLGEYRYYLNYIAPIKDEQGQIHSAHFISRETTSQKLSEKSTRESESKLKALFGSSQHLHVLMDLDQKLLWFNQRALNTSKILFSHELTVGQPMVDFLRTEHKQKFLQDFERSKKGEVVIYERHYQITDIANIHLEMMLQPIYEQGKLTGISLVGVETTERKLYEEKLEKINHELVQQNQRLNQYSYIISHDLRGPIVTLLGLVTLFENNKEGFFREEIIGYIKTSANHLDNIIKDLNMVLSQTGKDLNKDTVDLAAELKTVTDLLRTQIESVKISLNTDFTKIQTIYTVKSFIQSILLNLMSNAIKYKRKDVPLEINITTDITPDKHIRLSFADNGMGFDLQKNRDKVFNIYKRFHPQIEGKGLGLHLVKTQLELMKGRIEVESEVNKGTTFHIYLTL